MTVPHLPQNCELFYYLSGSVLANLYDLPTLPIYFYPYPMKHQNYTYCSKYMYIKLCHTTIVFLMKDKHHNISNNNNHTILISRLLITQARFSEPSATSSKYFHLTNTMTHFCAY